MDPIQHSETPSVAAYALAQAAKRRDLDMVLGSVPRAELSDTIRAHLIRRFGAGQADIIIRDTQVSK